MYDKDLSGICIRAPRTLNRTERTLIRYIQPPTANVQRVIIIIIIILYELVVLPTWIRASKAIKGSRNKENIHWGASAETSCED